MKLWQRETVKAFVVFLGLILLFGAAMVAASLLSYEYTHAQAEPPKAVAVEQVKFFTAPTLYHASDKWDPKRTDEINQWLEKEKVEVTRVVPFVLGHSHDHPVLAVFYRKR